MVDERGCPEKGIYLATDYLLPLIRVILAQKERLAEMEKALAKAFAESNLNEAKELAIQFRYYRKIQDAIREWAPGKPVHFMH